MSGKDAATRRQIRRAFGPEAAAVLREHDDILVEHHKAFAELIKTTTAIKLALPTSHTLAGRLRWLVTGR